MSWAAPGTIKSQASKALASLRKTVDREASWT